MVEFSILKKGGKIIMTKSRTVVKSWLPVFSGFYNSLWDNEGMCDSEFDYLAENGLTSSELSQVCMTECYNEGIREYHKDTIKEISDSVCDNLIELKVLDSFEVEGLVSPKEYNFTSDSINITYFLTDNNIKTIEKYLNDNSEAWGIYLKEHYTGCSGYIPKYDNCVDSDDWSMDSIINSVHQLGRVFEFILTNNNQKDVCELEYFYYDYIIGNVCLSFGDVDAIRQELIDNDFYDDNIETLTELYDSGNEINKKFLTRLVKDEFILTSKELKKKIDDYKFYDFLNKTNLKFEFVK